MYMIYAPTSALQCRSQGYRRRHPEITITPTFIPETFITANHDKISWSTDISLRRNISLVSLVAAQLMEETARESGLVSERMPALRIPRDGDTISTQACYDWDLTKWPQVGTTVAKRRSRSLSLISPVNDTSVETCQSRILLRPVSRELRDLWDTNNMNNLILKDVRKVNTNQSETLLGLAEQWASPSKRLSRRSNGISIAAVAVSLLRASESPARISRVNKVYQSHCVPRYHLGKFSMMMMIQGEPNSLPQTCSLRHGHSLLMDETV